MNQHFISSQQDEDKIKASVTASAPLSMKSPSVVARGLPQKMERDFVYLWPEDVMQKWS
jgi:hypothetical protein